MPRIMNFWNLFRGTESGGRIGGPGRTTWRQWATVAGLAAIFVVSAFFAAALDRFPGDLAVSTWVQSWRSTWPQAVAAAVSIEENGLLIMSLMLLLVGWMFLRSWRLEAILVLGCTVSGMAVVEIAKVLIDRPRPASDLVLGLQDATSQSYPSGNAALFGLYLMALAFAVAGRTADRRKAGAIWGLTTLLLIFVGLSRIYLGAHWLSDVLAGYLLGLTWMLASVQIIKAVHARRRTDTGAN